MTLQDSDPLTNSLNSGSAVYFTKVSDKLAMELKQGILSPNEYLVLVYMLQNADKRTGIVVTNARLLAYEISLPWQRVRSVFRSLKRKKRLMNPAGTAHDLRMKQGSRNPYPILLTDALTVSRNAGDTHETRMRHACLDACSDEANPPKRQIASGSTTFGTKLALKDKIRSAADKDKEKERSPKGPSPVISTRKSDFSKNSAAAVCIKYWKEHYKEVKNSSQSNDQFISNMLARIFREYPDFFPNGDPKLLRDQDDVIKALSIRLSPETGHEIFVGVEKARNVYAWLRSKV